MAQQNVVIKIQADVSKATNNIKVLQQVIAKLSSSSNQASSGAENLSKKKKKVATAAQLLDKEIKKVVAGQGDLNKIADLATAALKEQTAAAERLAKVSAAVEGAVGKEGVAILGANKQIGGLADASGAASFAILSLGQVFQDSAQFGVDFAQGFRAINNNIQQTFTAIALGSIQAGGFDKLLKLMGGSLWGPGGLILGFSALTAGIEFFSTRAQRAEKDADDMRKAFDEAINSMITFEDAMSGKTFKVSDAALPEAIRITREEIQRLQEIIDKAPGLAEQATSIGMGTGGGSAALAQVIAQQKEQNRLNQEKADAASEDLIAQQAILDALEGQLDLLGAQEVLAQRLRELGFEASSTERKKLTDLEKQVQKHEELVNLIFFTNGASVEQLGIIKAQNDIMEDFRDTTEQIAYYNELINILKTDSGGFKVLFMESEGQKILLADLKERLRIMLELEGFSQEKIDKLLLGPGLKASADEVERQNQRIRESFATLGTDLIASFATIGGGFDMFIGTMGRFMSRYGKEMIKHGLLTVKFGISIEAVKEALERFNGKAAIIAGLALVAIGSRLRSNARDASRRLQGGGGSSASGRFTAPSFGAMSMVPTIGQGSVFQSQQFSPVPQGSQNVQLVASGRSLVSVVGSEMSASSRRVGGTPVSFSGVTAASGVFVDINRDDLVK